MEGGKGRNEDKTTLDGGGKKVNQFERLKELVQNKITYPKNARKKQMGDGRKKKITPRGRS